MRRAARVAAALLEGAALAVVPVLAPASSSHAADVGSGHVTDFDVDVDVRPDGVLEVHESITYAFDDRGHGILRSIPYLYRWDDTHDREIELGQVIVTSRTAPDDVQAEREDGNLVLRIGDPDRVVYGAHTYELDYTVEAALNERGGHVELAWNGVGHQWRTRIEEARITVRAPALLRARCFHGPVGSDASCRTAQRDGAGVQGAYAEASFGPEQLRAYQAMTVHADLPTGSVKVAPPVLVERWSPSRAFSVTPLTVLLAVGGLALGAFVVARVVVRERGGWQGARGSSAAAGVPMDWGAVRDMRPGPLGTLVDERADVVDVTATIVDLAVRGHLRIEDLGADTFGRRDWRLVRLADARDDLNPFEEALLDKLFGVGLLGPRSQVRLNELRGGFAESMDSLRGCLYAEVVRRGWFRDRPDKIRLQWYVIGVASLMTTLGISALLVAFTPLGLLGVSLVVPAVALLVAARRMPARTPAGSAARQQAEALRTYFSTAVRVPRHPDESEQRFSMLLPYAMVLGLEDRWTGALASLAAQPHGTALPVLETPWYRPRSDEHGYPGPEDFGRTISTFSSAASSAMAATPSRSASGGGLFGGGWGLFGGGGGFFGDAGGTSDDGGGGSSGDGGGGGGGDGW